ncbi:MAG: hypothetical protein JWQ16_1095 [Novosphingobium sp.]|nr:hypothetical protein [Novosphingobium sp.]
MIRCGGLATAFALFGWCGERTLTRQAAWFWTAALTFGATAEIVPLWSLPVAMAAIGGAALFAVQRRESPAAEYQVLAWVAGALILLGLSQGGPVGQWHRIVGDGQGFASGLALLRWAAVACFAALLAFQSRTMALRAIGQCLAAALGYAAVAQVVPLPVLPLVPAAGALSLAAWGARGPWSRLSVATATLVVLSALWALVPLTGWLAAAIFSLGGIPMQIDAPDLAALSVIRRLLLPAMMVLGSLWLLGARLAKPTLLLSGGAAAGVLLISLHSLYRAGFAAAVGADFVTYGLAQRLLWDALLLAIAVGLWRHGRSLASRVAPAVVAIAVVHLAWYSLVLHNPLWNPQAVGSWPLVNLLIPLFAALPASLVLLARIRPDWAERLDRTLQPAAMAMIALFACATLRHAFHGTLLTVPGLPQSEDILRSLLGIVLAVGYLLWGIRAQRHSWRIASLVLMLAAVAKVFLLDASGLEGLLRIASFVALGFSLIGIGWLYSRQLKS